VARESPREELSQRRGRDNEALGAVASRRVSARPGAEPRTASHGTASQEEELAAEGSAASPCGSSIGGGSPRSPRPCAATSTPRRANEGYEEITVQVGAAPGRKQWFVGCCSASGGPVTRPDAEPRLARDGTA
jgi:hypothetical protein